MSGSDSSWGQKYEFGDCPREMGTSGNLTVSATPYNVCQLWRYSGAHVTLYPKF